ncbi:hypothetical protein [Dysgonomonas mossii]|uniref:hypothetical protein n=1 Tax=Dysgonomonas mossii TaxID=163665 RepID=UPI0026EA416F|nr:hypothetical protein [Dysgonomonas mossii]
MSAHSLQISLLNLPSRLNTFAAAWQIAAHSRSNWIHFFTCATSSSFKQAMAHWLQIATHFRQASIHD